MVNNNIFFDNIYFIVFFSLLYTIFPILLDKSTKYFKIKLDSDVKIDWANRFVSTINAVVTTVLSIIALSNSSEWVIHPFYSTCAKSSFIMKFLTFYFIFDTTQTLFYYKILFTWGILIHHIIGILTFMVLGIVKQESHYLILFYSLSECTTPFVNLRKHLYDLKLQDSIVYKVNGMIMALGFVFIRVLFITYSIYEMFQRGYEVPHLTQMFYYSLYPLITILNLYWSHLIVKGIIKALFSSSNKNSKNNNPKVIKTQ